MSKTVVTYFSASGVTARKGQKIAQREGADTFEIKPAVPASPERSKTCRTLIRN